MSDMNQEREVIRKRIAGNLRFASEIVRKDFADDLLAGQFACEVRSASQKVDRRSYPEHFAETLQRLSSFAKYRFPNPLVSVLIGGAALACSNRGVLAPQPRVGKGTVRAGKSAKNGRAKLQRRTRANKP